MNYPDEANNYQREHIALIVNSHSKLLGKELVKQVQPIEKVAREIFYAPFVIISHNKKSDPIFNYANLKALELFEFNWEEFTRLPSRLSAEPIHQTERDRLLSEVNQKGYIDNYQGIRIAKSGRKFLIKNATVWNLMDHDDNYFGQAAFFRDWEFI